MRVNESKAGKKSDSLSEQPIPSAVCWYYCLLLLLLLCLRCIGILLRTHRGDYSYCFCCADGDGGVLFYRSAEYSYPGPIDTHTHTRNERQKAFVMQEHVNFNNHQPSIVRPHRYRVRIYRLSASMNFQLFTQKSHNEIRFPRESERKRGKQAKSVWIFFC